MLTSLKTAFVVFSVVALLFWFFARHPSKQQEQRLLDRKAKTSFPCQPQPPSCWPRYRGSNGIRAFVFPEKTYWIVIIMRRSLGRRGSSRSSGSDDKKLPEPILIYHESAHSIVFRDHLRRAAKKKEEALEQRKLSSELSNHSPHKNEQKAESQRDTLVVPNSVEDASNPIGAAAHVMGLDQTDETLLPSEAGIPDSLIAGFTPRIKPLEPLELGPDDTFKPLLDSNGDVQTNWTIAEKEVFQKLSTQQACVKTIKNTDWTAFLKRFSTPLARNPSRPQMHDDTAPEEGENSEYPFTSFVTSTTMLPPGGKKMRCFGSVNQYTVGVVFALPTAHANSHSEAEACEATQTWSWPAGYAAKTEFNIDGRGQLINGRKEALRSLATLREYNEDYLTKEEYIVANRKVSGLNQVPYNEVFLRVGGPGRIVNEKDVATERERIDGTNGRSLVRGVGLPIALFVRSAKYEHLIALLRTRSRLLNTFGEEQVKAIPLLYITPEEGIRVLTDDLQGDLWKLVSRNLNPFQNSAIAHRTTVSNTDEVSFQQKVDELLHLDGSLRSILTPEELGRIAGGFGATDESVANVLRRVMIQDNRLNKERKQGAGEEVEESHKLQDVVNEGLAAAVRAGDFHTSRQLLILYSLVASLSEDALVDEDSVMSLSDASDGEHKNDSTRTRKRSSSMGRNADRLIQNIHVVGSSLDETKSQVPAPPPPPPLDTDRLRSATNSDGLLAVLGAAQILKAMNDGSAKIRTEESIASVEEWVNYGENSMAFRISSWYDLRAAQGDLKIATEQETNLMAFVSSKSINNRRLFAQSLREAAKTTSFTDGRFLSAISAMIAGMNKPCLRLELLQYVLGLDNRYSIAHVARSVELAATCLGISYLNSKNNSE